MKHQKEYRSYQVGNEPDKAKNPNNFIAFRVDLSLAHVIDSAVLHSGLNKTEWMIEAIAAKLGMDTPECRLNTAIDRLESVLDESFISNSLEEGSGSASTTEASSNSRVIIAADAALAAINKKFSDEISREEWCSLARLQRAALNTALASIID